MSIEQEKSEKIDDSLLKQTMIPYSNKNTVYLKEAYTDYKISSGNDKNYLVRGCFSISQSCYINDTGHFNAVEFNICYNQLMYTALAHGVSKKLLNCLQHLTLDEYYKKQLPDVYITRLESYYKKIIDPNNFSGVFSIFNAKYSRKLIIIKTQIEFSDYNGGLAYGEVDLAII